MKKIFGKALCDYYSVLYCIMVIPAYSYANVASDWLYSNCSLEAMLCNFLML